MLLSEMKDLSDEGRDFPIRWNIMHMHSSSQLAKLLAIHRGIDPELAGIAAALHDIGVVMTKKHEGHAEAALSYVYDFIERYNRESGARLSKVTQEETETIVKAIVQHSEKELNSDDPFVELLRDVDSIDAYLHGIEIAGGRLERCKRVMRELGIERPEDKSVLWHGKGFDFDVEERILPNGRKMEVGMIHHPGSAAILPVFENGSIGLIHQYRPAIGEYIWEIPSGTMLPGEDPLACAQRELREECGLKADRFEKIAEMLIAPWYSNERIHLFLATGLTSCNQDLDEDEILTPHAFPFHQVMSMVDEGEIQDAATLLALKTCKLL
jgi:8-oxo-dGTP pyrophosphatase MutT (NUDIX family)